MTGERAVATSRNSQYESSYKTDAKRTAGEEGEPCQAGRYRALDSLPYVLKPLVVERAAHDVADRRLVVRPWNQGHLLLPNGSSGCGYLLACG